MSAAAKKPSLSQACPECSAVLGQFREVFGENVEPLYFSENGHTIGKPPHGDPCKTVSLKDIVIQTKKPVRNGR
jgi:hypothetical protein